MYTLAKKEDKIPYPKSSRNSEIGEEQQSKPTNGNDQIDKEKAEDKDDQKVDDSNESEEKKDRAQQQPTTSSTVEANEEAVDQMVPPSPPKIEETKPPSNPYYFTRNAKIFYSASIDNIFCMSGFAVDFLIASSSGRFKLQMISPKYSLL
jgi:hypothetical protein